MLVPFKLITCVLFYFFLLWTKRRKLRVLVDKRERCVLLLYPDALLSNRGMGMSVGRVPGVCVCVYTGWLSSQEVALQEGGWVPDGISVGGDIGSGSGGGNGVVVVIVVDVVFVVVLMGEGVVVVMVVVSVEVMVMMLVKRLRASPREGPLVIWT